MPSNDVILELLETIPPTKENYEKIRTLFHSNFRLALDDFQYSKEWDPFLKLIRLIKFDVMQNPLDTLGPVVEMMKARKNIKLLAEKVETEEEFEQAKKMGFQFFQGYFFAKPK